MKSALAAATAALAVAAWFLGHAWKGLFIYFQGDDMYNLYQAWTTPAWKLLLANLIPFTSVYRPLGAAVYRVLFATAGWNPLAFRVVVYALFLANIFLVYRVARLLTESPGIALLSAFLFSYHHRLIDLYINNGASYDVLCATFFLLALIAYLQARPVLFLICYVLALNSKEMAAALPLILLAYDGIYRRRLGSWAVWASLVLTAAAFVMKTSAASAFASVPDYTLHLTARQFFLTTRPELSNLFFLREELNTTEAVLIFALIWGIAIAARSKPLLFAAAFVTLAPLPINFIAYRGFFVMYIPLAGWAMFIATALVEGFDWLWKTMSKREPERVFPALLLAYFLFNIQAGDPYGSFDRVNEEQGYIRTLKQGLAVRPRLPANGRVLLLHDPFAPDSYNPLIVVRLAYRDNSLLVDREPGKSTQPYDLVLDYDGQHYTQIH